MKKIITEYEGLVERDSWSENLCIHGDNIENIFAEFKGKTIKITITEVKTNSSV